MFENHARVLVIVRYVYAAGSKDFTLLETYEEFSELLGRLNPKDSVIIVKQFDVVKEGLVDQQFIDGLLPAYRSGTSWILIGPDNYEHTADWAYAESDSELRDELDDRLGNAVCVINEPNYISTDKTFDAYVPDSDGLVRPGAY